MFKKKMKCNIECFNCYGEMQLNGQIRKERKFKKRSDKLDKHLNEFLKNYSFDLIKTPELNEQGIFEINHFVFNKSIQYLTDMSNAYENKYKDEYKNLIIKVHSNEYVYILISEELSKICSALDIFKELPNSPKGGGCARFAMGKYTN